MSFITWDVEDVETGERWPYLFDRNHVPREGRVVTIVHRGQKRRVRRVFTPSQINVKYYDGQIGYQLPSKRHARQQGLPPAPGYDKETGLPRFSSRREINKYCAQLSRSRAYGKEVRWNSSE